MGDEQNSGALLREEPSQTTAFTREQIELRLSTLKNEQAMGHTQLYELERQVTSLREGLLRIGGAILILDELLAARVARTGAEPTKRE